MERQAQCPHARATGCEFHLSLDTMSVLSKIVEGVLTSSSIAKKVGPHTGWNILNGDRNDGSQ